MFQDYKGSQIRTLSKPADSRFSIQIEISALIKAQWRQNLRGLQVPEEEGIQKLSSHGLLRGR